MALLITESVRVSGLREGYYTDVVSLLSSDSRGIRISAQPAFDYQPLPPYTEREIMFRLYHSS